MGSLLRGRVSAAEDTGTRTVSDPRSADLRSDTRLIAERSVQVRLGAEPAEGARTSAGRRPGSRRSPGS